MGIIRLSELEPWIGVQKPAEKPASDPLNAAWAKASAVASTVDTAAAAFGGLDKAANDLTDGEAHPSEWTRRFDEAIGKLPLDGLAKEDFADFEQVARSKANRLKVAAVRHQREDIATRFAQALDGYVQRAADAPSNAIEAAFRRQALRAIERIDNAGLLGPGVADKLRAELPARIDRALALRVIERDPAHAATLLTQPGAVPALDEAERARLARKAGLRAERESQDQFLAEERARQGAVAELWLQLDSLDDTDIDAAVADGRLYAGEAQDLRERLRADRAAQQWRADAIDRVEAVFGGEGILDPASDADRKAVDAHLAEAERAWDDNQVPAAQRLALIGAYLGRTGMLPSALKKRIGGAFRAGDANRQNEGADIVDAVGRTAGRGVLVELPIEDPLQPILIRSLRDSGLEPASAAARATAILDGDAEARDRFFEPDLAAAGDWVEGSGCFDIGQIIKLRERFDGLIKLPDARNPDAGASDVRTTLLHRPGEDGPDTVALMTEQSGKTGKGEPAVVEPNSASQPTGDDRGQSPGVNGPAAASADPPNFAPTNLPMEPERKKEILDRLDRLAPDEITGLDHRSRVDLLKAIATDKDLMQRHRETARHLMTGIGILGLRSRDEIARAARAGEAIAADPDVGRILTRKQWSRATAEEREDVLRRIVAHCSRIYGHPAPAVKFLDLGQSVAGRYDQATNTVPINSFRDRYKESPEDVIKTTLEEATHAWQWHKLKSYAENSMSSDDPDRPLAEALAASHPFYRPGSIDHDAYSEHPSEVHAKEARDELFRAIKPIIPGAPSR